MAPKILIGLLTAHHPSREPYRRRARESFLRASPIDYKFVYGWPTGSKEEDALYAPCSDSKEWMVLKNQFLFAYALRHNYDYCFRACDDTWVFPERLTEAGLEKFDYAGQMPCKLNIQGTFKVWFQYFNYMHGGCGIWLSRKAMELLVADQWRGPNLVGWPEKVDIGFGLMAEYPQIDWDDRWIGECLQGHLAIDHPSRKQPMTTYAENNISVYEDDQLFVNDDPLKSLAVHDPGVLKVPSKTFEALKAEIKGREGMMVRT